jgi:hypothetical protein
MNARASTTQEVFFPCAWMASQEPVDEKIQPYEELVEEMNKGMNEVIEVQADWESIPSSLPTELW